MSIQAHDALYSLSQKCCLSPSGSVFSDSKGYLYSISLGVFAWLKSNKYIEVNGNGMYMITDAGRAALESKS